jgi:hypothetical protein
MKKRSNLLVADQFRRCKEGSTFLVTIGPVYKKASLSHDVRQFSKVFVRVSQTHHTQHALTFEVFLVRKARHGRRYLDFDIHQGIWTYVRDQNRWSRLKKMFPGADSPECWRGDPRVVTDIKVVHCEEG